RSLPDIFEKVPSSEAALRDLELVPGGAEKVPCIFDLARFSLCSSVSRAYLLLFDAGQRRPAKNDPKGVDKVGCPTAASHHPSHLSRPALQAWVLARLSRGPAAERT